jgi:hypothetical protein
MLRVEFSEREMLMTSPTTSNGSASRLRNGELRAMVEQMLADNRGTDLGPRAIAKILDRSSGAVGNALKALVGGGLAEVASLAPLRYRATSTTGTGRSSAPTPTTPPSSQRSKSARRGTATARPDRSASPSSSTATKLTPPAATAEPVTGPVVRPNGTAYHPRLLSGMPDVTALRRLREAGVPALMYGPPGTGKTSVVEAAFPDLITVPGDGDTTVADLVGEYTQTGDGRYVFVHGPLVRAMREGRPLFIDDATLIPPTVLAVVYPAMDGRRQLVVKANGGELVDSAPGFYIVAGHNPGVHGAILTDALSSRFAAQIQVSTDYDLATQLKIDKRAVKIARNLATRQDAGEVGWVPQLRELLAFQKIAEVLGAEAAAGNLIGAAPEDDRPIVAAVARQVFGKDLPPLALGARI